MAFDIFKFKLFLRYLADIAEYKCIASEEAKAELASDPNLIEFTESSFFSKLDGLEHIIREQDPFEDPVVDCLEIKYDDVVVGAKASAKFEIFYGADKVFVYLEFAHLPDNKEYVGVVHADDMAVKVLSTLGRAASKGETGSEAGRAILDRAIKNTFRQDPGDDSLRFFYRLLLTGEDFEIWKVGHPDEAYQIICTAKDFISCIDADALIHYYLRDSHPASLRRDPPKDRYDSNVLKGTLITGLNSSMFANSEKGKISQVTFYTYTIEEMEPRMIENAYLDFREMPCFDKGVFPLKDPKD